jgi:hypothetical protein
MLAEGLALIRQRINPKTSLPFDQAITAHEQKGAAVQNEL